MAPPAKTKTGSLELILGCMFSGKSTELIRRIRMRKVLQQNILVITHACDTRYTSIAAPGIVSHDALCEQAIAMESLSQVFDVERGLLTAELDAICIEEGQFFPDLWDTVTRLMEAPYHKQVIVSALDGDYQRRPFRQVVDLIPLAEQVVKLQALCVYCRDGTPACFSMRLLNVSQASVSPAAILCVGGKEAYASVCRYHYTALNTYGP